MFFSASKMKDFLLDLVVADFMEYLPAILGGLSVASLLKFGFEIRFGLNIDMLLQVYDYCVDFLLEPLADALFWSLNKVSAYIPIHIPAEINSIWRHAVVLMLLYVRRHASNEYDVGHAGTALFQMSSGLLLAALFGILGSAIGFDGMSSCFVSLSLFCLAIALYDISFIVWAAAHLREKYARLYGRAAKPKVEYIRDLGSIALKRNVSIFAITCLFLLLVTQLQVASPIAITMTLVIILIGVSWAWVGLERAIRESDANPELWLGLYRNYPAGKLGKAIMLPMLIGLCITLAGITETRVGKLLELLLT